MKNQLINFTLCFCFMVTVFGADINNQFKPPQKTVSIDEYETGPQSYRVRPYYKHLISVTVYNATHTQCDSTPNILADGTKINVRKAGSYRYCAMSRDLLKRWGGIYSFGDTIYLPDGEFFGNWIVRDVMNARHRNSIDLLIDKNRLVKFTTIAYRFE